MNAVKCSVMTGQHDRSVISHTAELLNAHAHDNTDRTISKPFFPVEDLWKTKSAINAIFGLLQHV